VTEPDTGSIAGQHDHWESTFVGNPDMYGFDPSESAVAAATRFGEFGASQTLELGSGQGRDTFYFVRRGFDMTAVDYTESGLEALGSKAVEMGATVRRVRHDVREPLPFPDCSFDACYSHMLFCMALTTGELVGLAAEIRRVLRPGGVVAYTARTTSDAHHGIGRHHGDALYENGGFIVHFFSPELIDRLSDGFDIIDRFEFTEGDLPRRLVSVTMLKS